MPDMQSRDDAIDRAIRQIKKGVMTADLELAGVGYMKLNAIGRDAAPALLCELRRIDLKKIDPPGRTALVAGLGAILHDISEGDSDAFMEEALSGRHHPVNGAVLRIIGRYRRSQYRAVEFNGIEVLESAAIDKPLEATKHLLGWLRNIPAEDLAGITRIYIIEETPEQDFLGRYLPSTAIVTLVWKTLGHPNVPMKWLSRINMERTFYHEIGHHKSGHKETGQVPEQEQEADRYANERMRESRPALSGTARFLYRLGVRKRRKTHEQDP